EQKEANKAENKGWRASFKAQREAARTALLWDTPFRRAATFARARLLALTKDDDLDDPQIMDDLVSVTAEKFLPDVPGGTIRRKAVDPSQIYVELKDEFPLLVTTKNQKEIYRRAWQAVEDMITAAKEAAR